MQASSTNAATAISRQKSESPHSPELTTKRAFDLYRSGRFKEARSLYERLSATIGSSAFCANIQLCKKGEELLDVSADSSRDFYNKGCIEKPVSVLHKLDDRGLLASNKSLRGLKAFLDGLHRLREGWTNIPPRQPNPGHFPMARSVLYCLHQSVPHATNGYSTRSHGIAKGLLNAGYQLQCVTRPGFPYDIDVSGITKGCHEQSVDGVLYHAEAGWALDKTPLDHYLAQAADLFFRRAQLSGSELIVAASNHITGLPALIAARRLGVPFVYEVRGLWEVSQASVQPEWKDSDRYRLMRTLEQQVCREADHIIAITEEIAQELQTWGVPQAKISIVPNAVDPDAFQPGEPDAATQRELRLGAGVPVIGYAGSAVAYEGLELLLEALALLKQRHQDFVFVLVGDGKAFDAVKQRAEDLGIADQCRFVGRVPFDQVQRYISCMEIMPVPRLSCAVTEMVSALKPLEAMAMGKAVVLSDVLPHQTMAGAHSERALLFQKDSATSLSTCLQQLIDNPGECQRLGQAARTWIERERSWNQVTTRYADALEQLREVHQSAAGSAAMASAKDLSQISLGLIADQFTTDTLASAVKVVPLSPDHWREELASERIDALFVESAWKGNQGQWHRMVGYYSDEEFAPLQALLEHCRELGIPSLFWNKEDPIHFDRFRKVASLCDHVFTTDSRRIIPYLATPGAITKTASSCPFYASPKIHNLLPSTRPWQDTAAYGGTYYGKRYPERSEYTDKIMSAAAPLGLTIYDRQHSDPDSPYHYPSGLSGYVAGDLTYKEMIQAYKGHPVQINVNSVLDSPTMFSRRVIEALACGAALVSGPALGMNRYLDGAAQVVNTESETAQALENLLQHPAYRWRMALKGARAVMRSHTTQHRLTQMLRTAGAVLLAPEHPGITLLTEEITDAAAGKLLAQTLRPQRIIASKWAADTQANLKAAGIQCDSPQNHITEAGSLWLLAAPQALATLDPEDLEDLAWPTVYIRHALVGFDRCPKLAEGVWPGVALENHAIDTGLCLVRPNSSMPISEIIGWAAQQHAFALRKPPHVHEQAPNVVPKKTVVIAGHDLKFIKPFYHYFTKAGIRLLLDFWSNHTQHDEVASKRLLRQADSIFCEWTLGNAIWYSKHKLKGQKLVGRLHLQEIKSALFPSIPFEAFDTVIFVAPHILRQAIKKNPALNQKGMVVFNGVDLSRIRAVPRKPTNGKTLGLVGIVPQRKRFDLALDILRDLRKEDNRYTLRVKGKMPEEYPWMINHKAELAWYTEQFRRLKEDNLLIDSVFMEPFGDDMAEWYSSVDFVLSTSDFESFHFTIADGAAAGCQPIILPWEGASELYPQEWICNTPELAAHKIANTIPSRLLHLRQKNKHAVQSFDIPNIFNQISSLL